MPVWKFTPLTATTVSVSTIETKTIQYLVTNQSTRSHTLTVNNLQQGISQNTSTGNCANPFTLGSMQSCVLTLIVDGAVLLGDVSGGPIACEQGKALQCYQPSAANSLNITAFSPLSASVSNLALSVNDPSLNTALTGNPRTITITNTDTANAAEDISITSSDFPSGTTLSSTTCGSLLNPGASCTITVTPGAIATSTCGAGRAPTPGVITVSASNVPASVTIDVEVLTYGCIYQGGYIYSIDDSTSLYTSVGGATASLSNNASTMVWWNGTVETTGATNLDNGSTNTAAIISAQGDGDYAAEACDAYSIDSSGNSPCATGTCYDNWYLPAICQIAASGGAASCSTTTQNMVTNLPALAGCIDAPSCLFPGYYWSSTEESTGYVWADYIFASNAGDFQITDATSGSNIVRCSRALTS